MAVLAVVNAVTSGINPVPTVAASAGGDSFPNTGREILIVKNADASPHTVTIQTPQTVDGLAVAERAVVVTNATSQMMGPFPIGTYSDTGGNVNITYDAVTSVTVLVVKVQV
jgi:hypothetical protein